jgi:hypothetical protein
MVRMTDMDGEIANKLYRSDVMEQPLATGVGKL